MEGEVGVDGGGEGGIGGQAARRAGEHLLRGGLRRGLLPGLGVCGGAEGAEGHGVGDGEDGLLEAAGPEGRAEDGEAAPPGAGAEEPLLGAAADEEAVEGLDDEGGELLHADGAEAVAAGAVEGGEDEGVRADLGAEGGRDGDAAGEDEGGGRGHEGGEGEVGGGGAQKDLGREALDVEVLGGRDEIPMGRVAEKGSDALPNPDECCVIDHRGGW